MKLVEVVNSNYTNELTTRMTIDLARQMGKIAVLCRDSPGFVVNRVARPSYIESLRLAEENSAILLRQMHCRKPRALEMGPFKLMDLIGNDINYAVSCSVYEQLNRPGAISTLPIYKKKK